MLISRRSLLCAGSLALAGLSTRRLAYARAALMLAPPPTALDPHALTPFVDALPIPAVARASGRRADPANPAQQLPYYRITMQACAQRMHREHRQAMDRLLAHIAAHGAVKASDFERARKGPTGPSGWWGWKDEKRWLEALFALGEVMISRRENFQRVYDLPERVLQRIRVEALPVDV